jgi:hypothetical protein
VNVDTKKTTTPIGIIEENDGDYKGLIILSDKLSDDQA